MTKRVSFLLLATLVFAGCGSTSATPEQRQADMCRMYRGYLSTQEPQYVMESCEKQMGVEACRQCLQ